MKTLFLFISISLCLFWTVKAQQLNTLNQMLEEGQFEEATQKLDSLLQIRKHQKDPYYHYLNGRLYQGRFNAAEHQDLTNKTKYLSRSFLSFLEAFENSYNQNSINKVYQNSSVKALNRLLQFSESLAAKGYDSLALDLLKMAFEESSEVKKFQESKIAEAGIAYATVLEKSNSNLAMEVYEELEARSYSNYKIYLNLSYLYQEENDFEKVTDILLQGWQKNTGNKKLLTELINYAHLSEKRQEILEVLEEQFQKDNQNFDLALAIGTLYDKIDEFEGAKKYYKIAIDLRPEFLELRYNYAVLIYNQFIDLNKFLMTGNSELSFQDLNAQRMKLLKTCEKQFLILQDKDFRPDEIGEILNRLDEMKL